MIGLWGPPAPSRPRSAVARWGAGDQRWLAAGFELVLVARSEPNLLTFQEHLAARHDTTSHVLPADLATEAGVRALLRATKDLDVGLYAAAAGLGTSGRFLDADTAVEVEMLRLNCEPVTVTALEVGRRMANRGRGGMLLMSSLVGFQGMPNAAHYAATKAYVQTLAEALHVELGPLGVDVPAVAPGPTHSGFADRAGMRMGHALDADTVARAALTSLVRRPDRPSWAAQQGLRAALLPLPRPARVRAMGAVMGRMTAHR
ncbi:MAG: SDR family NAD(P)-dependent oxidoreductase [Terrabacter sp.]